MKKTCGAKARSRSGEPCLKPPALGRARCRLHGGASLIKTGKWTLAKRAERKKIIATSKTLRSTLHDFIDSMKEDNAHT